MSAGKTQRAVDAIPIVNMRSTILGWFRPIVVSVIQQSVSVEGVVKLTPREIQTSGVLQPLEENLNRLRDGGRSWAGWTLHTLPNIELATNTRIEVKGKHFTVMSKTDYTDNGFLLYILTEAPHTYGS